MPSTSAITRINIGLATENPVFGEQVLSIELEDEAGGCFFILRQDDNVIRINPEEIPLIAKAARRMLRQPWVRKHEEE